MMTVKNEMIEVLVKMIIYGILVHVIVNVITLMYLHIKNCAYNKLFFGKLVLACEDEILNTK